MSYLLEANGIVKDYTGHKALDDVTVHVPEGSVYGLLGPNGAGKTTLIRIINHITAPDAGEVIFDGRPLTADDVKHIGYLPEERGLYKKNESRGAGNILCPAERSGQTRCRETSQGMVRAYGNRQLVE